MMLFFFFLLSDSMSLSQVADGYEEDASILERYHISHPGKTKKMTNVRRVVFRGERR